MQQSDFKVKDNYVIYLHYGSDKYETVLKEYQTDQFLQLEKTENFDLTIDQLNEKHYTKVLDIRSSMPYELKSNIFTISILYNSYFKLIDQWCKFEEALKSGLDYLGRQPKSKVNPMLKPFVDYCFKNPDIRICIETKNRDYEIYKRGEFVNISLPHHCRGGEKDWITKDGITQYLVNVD